MLKESPEAENAELLDSGIAKNLKEVRDIRHKQDDLRSKIASSDLLTEDDKQTWNRKLENARGNISQSEFAKLQQKFSKQQNAIKGLVDAYTKKVMDNKEEAFAIDKTRDIDTARDYLKWFETQSCNEKQSALQALDAEIDERKNLRKHLLTKLDKKEVVKMRRSEMKDKLKELESVESNSKRYKAMLQKDAKLFHDINLYIEAFEDLTPQEQEDWIRRYEDEIAKPRRELVETHDKLPKKFQSTNFLKMPSRKKQEYLDATELKIERQYTAQINKIPTEIWSDESKRFAIDDFMRLTSLTQKAQWLEFLPKAIKAEEKLAKRFKDSKFKEVRKMPDYSKKKWERSKFEDKEQMLKSMEAEVSLLDSFKSIMNKSVKDKVISEKTKERYMEMYNDGDLSNRRMAVRSIMTALAPRRSLLKDFEKLSPETQKKFSDFYDRGHKARLEIYKKAKAIDAENALEESEQEIEEPESLEQNDVKQIVEKLQKQADANEQLGNLEKALGLHEAVIAMHPKNQYSKDKIEQIKMELNAVEAASNEDVLEAIDSNMKNDRVQQREIRNIELAEQILEDQEQVVTRSHGNENLAKQSAHLGSNEFDRAVNEELVKRTHGKKVIDRQGETKKVRKIDVRKIETNSNSTIQTEKDLRNLSERDNLDNIQLVDSVKSKSETTKEAKKRLEKRKNRLEKKILDDETFSLDKKIAA